MHKHVTERYVIGQVKQDWSLHVALMDIIIKCIQNSYSSGLNTCTNNKECQKGTKSVELYQYTSFCEQL